MNRIWKEIGIAVLMGMVLPGLILHVAVEFGKPKEDSPPTPGATDITREDTLIPVMLDDGGIRQMELDAYLTGVVLAEMPASFESEALKAQAVVARTYTLRAHTGKSKHTGASVCTDSRCCQGYIEEAEYLQAGGSEDSIRKIQAAVGGTSGFVLTYEGDVIEATYFSCSGGRTEDAVAVWGTDVPYLRSVDSPGEEDASHYTDRVHFIKSDLEEKLGITLPDNRNLWFYNITYTAGGGVAEIGIGEKRYTGTELRKLLGLRSTAFTITHDDTGVIFETRGYGHRVGMSQYGADAMALEGSTYREILAHYYPGTQLENRVD